MLDSTTIEKIKEIVSRHIGSEDYKVFVFGSRAVGAARKFSDIDLGIEGKSKVPISTIIRLKDEFEDSDLPYIVEIIDFSGVSKKFEKIAKKEAIYLN